jgi:alpha-tubulin suppressor-like RCC1 family protein
VLRPPRALAAALVAGAAALLLPGAVSAGWAAAAGFQPAPAATVAGGNFPAASRQVLATTSRLRIAALVSDGLGFCALSSSGTVSCWGSNEDGALGYGGGDFDSDVPLTVRGVTSATSVVANRGSDEYGYCATLRSGQVSCWGVGGGRTSNVPSVVSGLSGVTGLSSDGNGYCAVVSGGAVRCWGSNGEGQLGTGSTEISSAVPVAVKGLRGVTRVASDRNGSYCALLAGGRAECWGNGAAGSLGDGAETSSSTPVAVKGLSGATGLASDIDGYCALLGSGAAECWGVGAYGGLGNGTTTGVSEVPVAVKGLSGATRLVGADLPGYGYCALLRAGGVDCWGSNAEGELGNGGSEPDSDVPVAVKRLSGVTRLAASPGDFCAGEASGAECWGGNSEGQLGDGSTTSASAPVAVHGLSGVTDLAGGSQGYCALADGRVFCWGSNEYGQLGAGSAATASTSSVPVRVAGLAS